MKSIVDYTQNVNIDPITRATPGVTTRAGIRQVVGVGGSAGGVGLPVPAQNSWGAAPSPASTSTKHIVHFRKLRQLLRPLHPYFHDKQGRFTLALFQHKVTPEDGQEFYFPRPCFDSTSEKRRNPYHHLELVKRSAVRTFRQLEAISKITADLRLGDITLTAPKEMSLELSRMGDKGIDFMWACYRRFWKELPGVLGIPGELGARANLHIWSSRNPLNPHYHIHLLLLNYAVNGGRLTSKYFGQGIIKEYSEHLEVDGKTKIIQKRGYVPFSDSELLKVKALWLDVLQRAARRHGLKCQLPNDPSKIGVNVQFASIKDAGRCLHWLEYEGRHWDGDFIKYYQAEYYHPEDCPNPPEWLENYKNNARKFGFWRALKDYSGEIGGKEKAEKVDPITKQTLAYVGKVDRDVVDELQDSIEEENGLIRICELSLDDIAWLKHSWQEDLYERYSVENSEFNSV